MTNEEITGQEIPVVEVQPRQLANIRLTTRQSKVDCMALTPIDKLTGSVALTVKETEDDMSRELRVVLKGKVSGYVKSDDGAFADLFARLAAVIKDWDESHNTAQARLDVAASNLVDITESITFRQADVGVLRNAADRIREHEGGEA